MASLQHANIVQVFDFGQHGELPCMALEYVNGGSLNARLRDGLPGVRESAWLVEQLARGMAAAHSKGIIPPRPETRQRAPGRSGDRRTGAGGVAAVYAEGD